jgi:hypothetical protein
MQELRTADNGPLTLLSVVAGVVAAGMVIEAQMMCVHQRI